MTYVPELGQACFGREWHNHEPPYLVENWLLIIKAMLETDGWYDEDNGVFSMHPYWWGEEDDPEADRPNFKCGDVEVNFYKHIGRGMSTNTQMSDMDWHKMFVRCVQKAIEIKEAEQK